ncbi:hypothetical protein [Bacillus sp. NPDC077027]|uniref:hypothetical protein n=1 Tax=Bacillus sp. NPDC077027 TaxID=3390548 RepID=UPI003D05DFC8
MSSRRIVGAMFICMAAIIYVGKYLFAAIHYRGFDGFDELSFEQLEDLLPGGTWMSIIFFAVGLTYLLWDDREAIKVFFQDNKRSNQETDQ